MVKVKRDIYMCAPQHLLNIHFHAPALGAALLARDESASADMAPASAGRSRAAMLYFVFNANVVAVLVAHDLRVGEFVAQARRSGPGWGTFCNTTCCSCCM